MRHQNRSLVGESGDSIAHAFTHLIVNADDFGYFDEVSRGILDAAKQGVVTATGVMANGPAFQRRIGDLKALPTLSVGVHLNATLGRPLTVSMGHELSYSEGEFPTKSYLALAMLCGRIPSALLLDEWRAQITRCLDAGLKLEFLNSHEHVHMLPWLYGSVRKLANEFGIAHVRAPKPEWGVPLASTSGWLRSGFLAMAKALATPSPKPEPELIGIAPSGRLNKTYCEWRIPRLLPGSTYELMCHPGWTDVAAQSNPRLRGYHDWEGELHTLLSIEFQRLLQEHRVKLTRYTASAENTEILQ